MVPKSAAQDIAAAAIGLIATVRGVIGLTATAPAGMDGRIAVAAIRGSCCRIALRPLSVNAAPLAKSGAVSIPDCAAGVC